MKLDDNEKRLLKVPYYPSIQIAVLICNIIFQPIIIYVFWDIFSKDEISIFSLIFFLIFSLFFLGLQYLYYSCEYVITNKRVIVDDGSIKSSLKLSDLRKIKIIPKGKHSTIQFSAKSMDGNSVTWIWVKYSDTLRQQLEDITSIKVES